MNLNSWSPAAASQEDYRQTPSHIFDLLWWRQGPPTQPNLSLVNSLRSSDHPWTCILRPQPACKDNTHVNSHAQVLFSLPSYSRCTTSSQYFSWENLMTISDNFFLSDSSWYLKELSSSRLCSMLSFLPLPLLLFPGSPLPAFLSLASCKYYCSPGCWHFHEIPHNFLHTHNVNYWVYTFLYVGHQLDCSLQHLACVSISFTWMPPKTSHVKSPSSSALPCPHTFAPYHWTGLLGFSNTCD